MQATPENKQKLKDWMAPVNPLEGNYEHCFARRPKSVDRAYRNYPTRVDKLPFYATKWCYPYYVPKELEQKYAPDAPNGILHWARGVAWAVLEQKADTIFVLTTNYIDGWRSEANKRGYEYGKMAKALEAMCRDVYGKDEDDWPTINVVVLNKAGQAATAAYKVMNNQFGPIVQAFDSDSSVIEDIKDYMNKSEQELYYKYKAQ